MEMLPQADYDMHQSRFFIVTASLDGETWTDDELVEGKPIPRVRELLGGRWSRSSSYGTYIKAFFNGQKRVLVLGFPPDKTKEEVLAEMKRIREGREDRS
jgi:hypothetical protein